MKQLGDCLGRGAFGSVYRALNWNTGETVAVKQIKLTDLPKSELRVIMVRPFDFGMSRPSTDYVGLQLEIDLLKNLDVRRSLIFLSPAQERKLTLCIVALQHRQVPWIREVC